jgi:CheY-like chemotaxis protein
LASVLVRQGILTEKLAVTHVGRQLDVLGVDLSSQTLDLQLFERLPLEFCEQNLVFPLRFENGWLLVAVCDPRDTALLARIEARGMHVAVCVALEVSLRHALAEARVALAVGLMKIMPNVQRDIDADMTEIETPDEIRPFRVAARSAHEATLLVVDPEASRRALTEAMLTRSGFRVRTAPNAGDALELSSRGVDLVIIDATMPEFAAFDLCRRLRLQRPNLPVVLTSAQQRGWRFARDVQGALGVAGYLEGPFASSELVDRARAILKLGPVPAQTVELQQSA